MLEKLRGQIKYLINLLFRKKGNAMKITVKPGILSYEVAGLLPGQAVQVTASNAVGTGPAATYTAPADTAAPEAPEVTD